jgi:hypothetical protein
VLRHKEKTRGEKMTNSKKHMRKNVSTPMSASIVLLFLVSINLFVTPCGSGNPTTSDGVNGDVYALTVYQGALIVGGQFGRAGGDNGIDVSDIARWDGYQWHALGSGIGPVGSKVNALAVYNGNLIAAGDFTTAGGVTVNRIARWDGNQWYSLGSGFNGPVRALTVYNGKLIAGGSFTQSGGTPLKYRAQWDGSQWTAIGSQDGAQALAPIYSLTVSNGKLIAGGDFTHHIVLWSEADATWYLVGGGFSNGRPLALMEHNGYLIAGGEFTGVRNYDSQHGYYIVTPAYYIARFDWNTYQWSPIGSGMDTFVKTLTEFNGDFIAGGDFNYAGGSLVEHIVRWDGGQWQALGSGMSGAGPVYSLMTYNGELIAGGWFTTAGSVQANNIACWNGASWHALTSSPPPDSVTILEVIVRTPEGYIVNGVQVDVYNWFLPPPQNAPLYSGITSKCGQFFTPLEWEGDWGYFSIYINGMYRKSFGVYRGQDSIQVLVYYPPLPCSVAPSLT